MKRKAILTFIMAAIAAAATLKTVSVIKKKRREEENIRDIEAAFKTKADVSDGFDQESFEIGLFNIFLKYSDEDIFDAIEKRINPDLVFTSKIDAILFLVGRYADVLYDTVEDCTELVYQLSNDTGDMGPLFDGKECFCFRNDIEETPLVRGRHITCKEWFITEGGEVVEKRSLQMQRGMLKKKEEPRKIGESI